MIKALESDHTPSMPLAEPRLESAQLFVDKRSWSLQSQDIDSVICHCDIVILLSAIERARIKIGLASLIDWISHRLVDARVKARCLVGTARVVDGVQTVAHRLSRARYYACLGCQHLSYLSGYEFLMKAMMTLAQSNN